MQPNLKNQKELVKRIRENGSIPRPMWKYKLTVDGNVMGEMYSEPMSEVDARIFCKQYAKDQGISSLGVNIERVINKMKYTVLPHYGKVS